MKGELEHIDPAELEKAITKWLWSVCPVCQRVYPHSRFYKPQTCLAKDCILAQKEKENAARQ